MTIRKTIEDREWDKFEECTDGKTAVRSKLCDSSITPSGLNVAGLITEVTLATGSWTALPPTALTDRNAMSIQNNSGQTIFLQYDNTVVGTTPSILLPTGAERFYDIKDTVLIYAKATSGTPVITVEEIS